MIARTPNSFPLLGQTLLQCGHVFRFRRSLSCRPMRFLAACVYAPPDTSPSHTTRRDPELESWSGTASLTNLTQAAVITFRCSFVHLPNQYQEFHASIDPQRRSPWIRSESGSHCAKRSCPIGNCVLPKRKVESEENSPILQDEDLMWSLRKRSSRWLIIARTDTTRQREHERESMTAVSHH